MRSPTRGACSSGEVPVRDALRPQASSAVAVLSCRAIAHEWQGFLLYPAVPARLANAPKLGTADDYMWALDLALLDAVHLWAREHEPDEDCERHEKLKLPDWPSGT